MTTTASATQLRHQLVDQLVERGDITDTAWQDAFRSVPRHRFLSRFTRDGQQVDLTDPAQHDQAIRAAYTDDALLTQHDAGGTATSSSTEVGLMARMLELLDAHDDHRVLEIGSGTGYNAALLCRRLSPAQVTTVDIDPALVLQARAALAELGYQPTIVAGDGADGVAANAPYDRIIATCGIHRVPPAWLTQTVPGGVILANVGFSLISLTVSGGIATGRFLPGTAGFMRLRHDVRHVAPTIRDLLAATHNGGTTRSDAPLPDEITNNPAAWLIELALPGVRRIVVHADD